MTAQTQEYNVTIPNGVRPNQQFRVNVSGREYNVTCPPGSRPGTQVRIRLPVAPTSSQSTRTTTSRTQYPANRSQMSSSAPPRSVPSNFSSSMPSSVSTVDIDSNTRDAAVSDKAGAFLITKTAGASRMHRVKVPRGVRPGTEFTVLVESRQVRLRCPQQSRPGDTVQISLPDNPKKTISYLQQARLTSSTGKSGGGAVEMSPDIVKINKEAEESGSTARSFLVTIPKDIYPGMRFKTTVEGGQQFMVHCPPNAGPGMQVRIVPPKQQEEKQQPKMQMFEVIIPPGVRENQPFSLMANGSRVLVTCPPKCKPGQKIRFQLPMHQAASGIKLKYENVDDGWTRTVRVTDMKFQWVRVDKDKKEGPEAVDTDMKFDFKKSAYVRKLKYMEGNDPRLRTGSLSLVPASEAAVDTQLVVKDKTLMSYADIAAIESKALEEKRKWLNNIFQQLKGDWEKGHVEIRVNRFNILEDSIAAVMALSSEDMRKYWRFEFIGEPCIDAGGVTREWFTIVSEQLFNPDTGLWLTSIENQMCMTINPASHISCPEDHLIYFRFLGRIMGRALFDQQLISGHLVRHLYKHILGWPMTFADLQHQDEGYYNSLKQTAVMDDVSMLCSDFTITENILGVTNQVELVEGGEDKEVTNENVADYLEACLQYKLLDREKVQLTELLLGFFDVVPEPVLTAFDHQELELLLCGIPYIDVEDWQKNTNYTGLYSNEAKYNKVVRWFWEVVNDNFDSEMKARLLQFVTGTTGVPPGGFAVLQGMDGNVKKFTIHGVQTSVVMYPKAHTCFNRIDLPSYKSKGELEEKLRFSIANSATSGFTEE